MMIRDELDPDDTLMVYRLLYTVARYGWDSPEVDWLVTRAVQNFDAGRIMLMTLISFHSLLEHLSLADQVMANLYEVYEETAGPTILAERAAL